MTSPDESVSVPRKVEGHDTLMAARISDNLLSVTKHYRKKTFEAKMYVFDRQTVRELRSLIPEDNRTLAHRLRSMMKGIAPIAILFVVLICCMAFVLKEAK